MFNSISGKLKGGVIVKSKTITCNIGEGKIANNLNQIEKQFSNMKIGSYPYFNPQSFGTSIVIRSEKIKDIDQNTLKTYNRVIEHRGGLAVVPLRGSACGGCGAHIPPQTVSEVRAKSAVHTCGVCGRFLYNN